MGKYTVTQGQNLYDIALHIYGSIEGITDLMLNNEDLSLAGDPKAGTQLAYTDGYQINREVAAYYSLHGITPASGERHVYPKSFTLPLTLEAYTSETQISAEFVAAGNGTIEADWGDNSPVQVISLTGKETAFSHIFDSPVKVKRKISLYMECELKAFDIGHLRPKELYILRPVYCERFTLNGATVPLDGLPMLRGVFDLRLDGVKTGDLLPLTELKELMSLSLHGTVYRQPAIDAYLIGLVKGHDNRRNCRVTLSTQPSGNYAEPARDEENRYVPATGMEAVWVLTHEEAWNEGGPWEFIINDSIYKYEQEH